MIFIIQPKLISTDHLNNRKHFVFSNLWANLVHFLLQISLLKWSSRTWEESKAMITKRCVSLVVLRIFVPHCILYVCILYNSLYGITCSNHSCFLFIFGMRTNDVSSTLRQSSQRMLYYYYRYCLKMKTLETYGFYLTVITFFSQLQVYISQFHIFYSGVKILQFWRFPLNLYLKIFS